MMKLTARIRLRCFTVCNEPHSDRQTIKLYPIIISKTGPSKYFSTRHKMDPKHFCGEIMTKGLLEKIIFDLTSTFSPANKNITRAVSPIFDHLWQNGLTLRSRRKVQAPPLYLKPHRREVKSQMKFFLPQKCCGSGEKDTNVHNVNLVLRSACG
jgi:hypothetical protein